MEWLPEGVVPRERSLKTRMTRTACWDPVPRKNKRREERNNKERRQVKRREQKGRAVEIWSPRVRTGKNQERESDAVRGRESSEDI